MNARSRGGMGDVRGTLATGDERAILGVPWAARQLLKVSVLIALVILAAREADLETKTLAETRARKALLAAIQRDSNRAPSAGPDLGTERLVASYEKACEECATPATCIDVVRLIRTVSPPTEGRGPCKKGLFGRWGSDDPDPYKR